MKSFEETYNYSLEQHNKIAWWWDENHDGYEIIQCADTQRNMDMDLLCLISGTGVFFEEKFIDNKPYACLAIEEYQNTCVNPPNLGWIITSQADKLAWHYCPLNHKTTYSYIMDMERLQKFYHNYAINKYKVVVSEEIWTKPQNRLVPWTDIEKYVGYEYHEIEYREE